MSQPSVEIKPVESDAQNPVNGGNDRDGGEHHNRWVMVACCLPMIAIAVILVATGVVGGGFIFAALMCTLMMALMMGAMSRGAGR